MRHFLRATLIPLGLLSLLASVRPLRAEGEGKMVIAEGFGMIIGGDKGKARDTAVENALRKAVEQVVGTIIESETATDKYEILSDKIYSQSKGFIKNYKILSENTDADGRNFTVKVEAEVAEGAIGDQLGSLGLLMRRMKMPRVVVLVGEKNRDHLSWWAGNAGAGSPEGMLIKLLRDKGFTLVDAKSLQGGSQLLNQLTSGDDSAFARAGKKIGAEVVIYGQAEVDDEGTIAGSRLRSYAGILSLRAVKADTGESLGSADARAKEAENSLTGALPKIYRNLTGNAGEDLVRQIGEQWQKEVSGGRMIMLTVSGASRSLAEALQKEISKKVRGAQSITMRSLEGSTATFELSQQGDAEDLSRELTKVHVSGYYLKISGQTANTLSARLVPIPPPSAPK